MKSFLSYLSETIVKSGSEYCVRSKKGKNLGCSPSRVGAVKRLRQVEYFKHMKEDIQLQEARRLYRFDDLPASGVPIIPKTYTYGFTDSGSGRADAWGTHPKGSDYHEKTGMFAGEYAHALPYSMPRNTRWIITGKRTKKEKQTLFVSSADRERIENHKTVLSEYRRKQQNFNSTNPLFGEYFAKQTSKPISQKIHTNPLKLISKHMHVVFVDDLDAHKKHLEQNNINHNAEGDFSTN